MMQPPQRRPRLTIGLPVYNGEEFLEEAIRSLLTQTYSDFELLVSDNGSTDGTAEIIRRLERDDPRIRSHFFRSNQGPAANYTKVVDMARAAEYFAWSAADDVRDPTFVEECVRALDDDPEAVLAYSRTRVIEEGKPPHDHDYEPNVDSQAPEERLRTLLMVDYRRHGAFEIFGVMRLKALREAGTMGSYARADSVMLARMALRGSFVRIPEYLFLNRNHPDRSVRKVPLRSYRGKGVVAKTIGSGPVPPDEWWDARKKDRIVWPEWYLLREYAAAIAAAPLSWRDRRACLPVLIEYVGRNLPKLGRDVLINAEYQLRRSIDQGRHRVAGPGGLSGRWRRRR